MTTQELERKHRLAEIEGDIRDSHGLITPDQEAEIESLLGEDATEALDAMAAMQNKRERLEAIMEKAKEYVKFLDYMEGTYRAKARVRLEQADYLTCQKCMHERGNGCKCKTPTTKRLESEGKLWESCILVPARGRIEPLVKPEEMPDEFRKAVTVYKAETDLIRMALEMGRTPATEDGRPIAQLIKETSIRITKDVPGIIGETIMGALK